MFKSFDSTNADIVMVPNPYYVLGPKPKLTQISWKKVPDAQTRLIAYQNGNADYIWGVAPADGKQIAQPANALNKELKIWPATAYWWWGLNLDKEPFNDMNFRKAVALSIDFKKAHDVVFGPLATLATSILPGGAYHRDDLFPKYYKFDQAAAKQAFKDSKYGGDPKKVPPVTFGVSTGYADHLLWAQVVQQMVKQSIGVSMQITAKDTFSTDERKGIDILSQSWGSATLDPSE